MVWLQAFFDLRTRWRWLDSFTARPIYPQGKSSWYPLDRRLGGPRSRSGSGGEEKNSQPPPGFGPRSSNRPVRRQSLYRLSIPTLSFLICALFFLLLCDSKFTSFKDFETKMLIFSSTYNCKQIFFGDVEQIRLWMTSEHLAAVLCTQTPKFSPNIGKLLSNCKQHHLSH
jgi:hypothetical protein